MQAYHAAVWLDHRHAKVYLFDRDESERRDISTDLPHHQIHNSAGSIDGKRAVSDPSFYRDIVAALRASMEWVILGPSSARDELAKYIRVHHPDLAGRIIGVEPSDHPTDGQIIAHARSFFYKADRRLPRAGAVE
ncbi:hypothetical protein BH10PSE7_BH10PSE7_18510 [soil metagenome]